MINNDYIVGYTLSYHYITMMINHNIMIVGESWLYPTGTDPRRHVVARSSLGSAPRRLEDSQAPVIRSGSFGTFFWELNSWDMEVVTD